MAFEKNEIRCAIRHFGARPEANVTVVIPTYKRPVQLLKAVKSVLEQEYEYFAIVIIDDGGGLPTLPNDNRIHAYSLSKNTGAAGLVRNVAVASSNSQYVAFLDDDNTWRPNHLSVAVSELESSGDIVYTSIDCVLKSGHRKWTLGEEFSRRYLRQRPLTDINGLVLKRAVLRPFSRAPRRKRDFPGEDWRLIYQISKRYTIRHVPVVTVDYLVNDESYFNGWTTHDLAP